MAVGTIDVARSDTMPDYRQTKEFIAKPVVTDWVDACTAPETADNSGSTVTNPGGITRSDQNRYQSRGHGNTVQVRLKYDDGITGPTSPVVQVFGFDANDAAMRLVDANGDHELTLTIDLTNDVTDGTYKYTQPVEVDLAGSSDVLAAVKTAFAATGTVNTSAIQVRVVTRPVTPPLEAVIAGSVTVNTEIPAAAALADATANPTTPSLGALGMVYNGTTWDRMPGTTSGVKVVPASAAWPSKTNYAASSNLTITLASLASDTNLLAGRESTLVDNTTNKYQDYAISGKVTAGTSPTASRVIEIHALAMMDDSTWPDSFTGADAAKTITSANIKNSICRLVASMDTSNTSDRTYHFGPVSLRALFGFCPAKFLVWVVHSTGVNLNSTGGNHQITVKGLYETLG